MTIERVVENTMNLEAPTDSDDINTRVGKCGSNYDAWIEEYTHCPNVPSGETASQGTGFYNYRYRYHYHHYNDYYYKCSYNCFYYYYHSEHTTTTSHIFVTMVD